MPKISVIITVYKHYDYLLESIEAVFAQTFKDFEIIVINDGSNKKISNLIKNSKFYNKNNFNFYNVQRLKRSACLNFAISKAVSEIICILDADDLWHPKKLEIQYFYFSKFNLDFLSTRSPIFSNNKYLTLNSKKRLINKIVKYELFSKNIIAHSSVMYKKNLAIYNENIFTNVDIDIWLKLISQNINLYFLNISLTYIRKHNKQYFPGNSKTQKFKYFINSIKVRINNANNFNDYILVFLYVFRSILLRSINVILR